MPITLDPTLRRELTKRIRYYNDLGIYDFYRRDSDPASGDIQPEERESMTRRASAVEERLFENASSRPESTAADPSQALRTVREDLGDCTRCRLHKQGRKQIVFGVGSPHADVMFIGEAPGADEDEQGIPFIGRAGQLLTNMIKAMGLTRDDVYIANVIKCRPPGNRTPERDECNTCSPFLLRQIDVVRPKIIVALGAVAAKSLLQINDSMANLRGRTY